MMSRFVSALTTMARVISFAVPWKLVRLMQSIPGVDVVQLGDPVSFDYDVNMFSLPGLRGVTIDTIPNTAYLQATTSRSFDKFTVGVVWQGSKTRPLPDGVERSIDLATFSRLFRVPLQFVSLQLPPVHLPNVLTIELPDFADTASVIMGLDLVISVDTAVAHLAGALGKPVWILLPTVPDWRWFIDRTDSPWYPTARLFRQQPNQSWSDVVDVVAGELRKGLKVQQGGYLDS